MTDFPTLHKGMWFEEFEAGQRLVTADRMVSDADVATYAELSGDSNPIHLDPDYARKSAFGQRIAHGLLVLSIAVGLLVQTGLLDGTIDAFREIRRWKFRKPVYFGDIVRVKLAVEETQPLRGLGSGIVQFGIKVINQDDAAVMSGQLSVLVQAKPV